MIFPSVSIQNQLLFLELNRVLEMLSYIFKFSLAKTVCDIKMVRVISDEQQPIPLDERNFEVLKSRCKRFIFQL